MSVAKKKKQRLAPFLFLKKWEDLYNDKLLHSQTCPRYCCSSRQNAAPQPVKMQKTPCHTRCHHRKFCESHHIPQTWPPRPWTPPHFLVLCNNGLPAAFHNTTTMPATTAPCALVHCPSQQRVVFFNRVRVSFTMSTKHSTVWPTMMTNATESAKTKIAEFETERDEDWRHNRAEVGVGKCTKVTEQ